MKPISTFNVTPAIPSQLEKLTDLAYNLRWSWDYETRSLFRRLDPDLWESSSRNPVSMLGRISQSRLNEAAEDIGFQAHYERVCQNLDRYLHNRQTWFRQVRGQQNHVRTAGTECRSGTERLRTAHSKSSTA
ncbi:MAG: DUF3417 domain-containing protein [Pseudomonadota bacterium]